MLLESIESVAPNRQRWKTAPKPHGLHCGQIFSGAHNRFDIGHATVIEPAPYLVAIEAL
jgi:hypothetical protein